MNTSKCKACGAEIIWVLTTNGKRIPCNTELIPYRVDIKDGDLRIVTNDGRVVTAKRDETAQKYGLISHFATCPAADRFRRAKK